MTMKSQFAQFAEIEDQLRDALIEFEAQSKVTKTERKKLAKAARHKPKVYIRPLVGSFAHIVVSCRAPWGGNPIKIDYKHTNCSLFEAQMAVDKLIQARNLSLHVVLKKEVCDLEVNKVYDQRYIG